MQKEITVYTYAGDFILPHKIMARRVLKDVYPEFNFWIHESLTLGYEFTVSEGSCGASIANGLTELQTMKDARSNLTKQPIEIVRDLINKEIEVVKKAKETFLNDPLWNALSSAGYNMTQGEIAVITASLAHEGFEITPIKKQD